MYDWKMNEILERHIQTQPDHNRWWQRFRQPPGRPDKVTIDILAEIAEERTNILEMRQAKRDIMARRDLNVWKYETQ
jgi:hypothetical protein